MPPRSARRRAAWASTACCAAAAARLSGILNGIDTQVWNPATDPHLAARFTATDAAPRAPNKAALQARFGLAPDPDAPLFVVVSRLAWQKGLDLLLDALPALLGVGGQLAMLGSGEPALEAALPRRRGAPSRAASAASSAIDEALAQLVQAAPMRCSSPPASSPAA